MIASAINNQTIMSIALDNANRPRLVDLWPNTSALVGQYFDARIHSACNLNLKRTNPMPLSMYQLSVPVYVQYLEALSRVLDKAAAHCKAHKIDESALLQMRVFPDMLPMTRQVSIALYHSGGTVTRLAGQDVPDYFAADALSFAELKGRVAMAIDLIKGVAPEQLEGSEDREFELTQAGQTFNFTGQVLLQNYALPQFCFHATTAYNLLRHAGVDIDKRDFMGELPK